MRKKNRNEGSLTLEAAMVVPLFIMIMLALNGIFVLFMGQQVMVHAMVQSAKSLAYDPYTAQRIDDSETSGLAEMFSDIFSLGGGGRSSNDDWYKNQSDVVSAVESRFATYLKDSESEASELLELIGVKGGFGGLDFSGTTLDGDILNVKLKYTQDYIYNAVGLASFEREINLKIRIFNYK